MLKLLPGRSIAEYRALRDVLATNEAVARQQLLRGDIERPDEVEEEPDPFGDLDFDGESRRRELPPDIQPAPARSGPELFVETVRTVHQALFRNVYGFAGLFREISESAVTFGGPSPQHVMEAAEAHLIVPHLIRLFEAKGNIENAPHTKDAFSAWAAAFTRRFFTIHPFRDGNGRTARFLVELAASATPSLYVVPRHLEGGAKSADRRAYVSALQYAHKHAGSSPAHKLVVEPRDPHTFLARWWHERLEDDRDYVDDAPPAWLPGYDETWIDPDALAEIGAGGEVDEK